MGEGKKSATFMSTVMLRRTLLSLISPPPMQEPANDYNRDDFVVSILKMVFTRNVLIMHLHLSRRLNTHLM